MGGKLKSYAIGGVSGLANGLFGAGGGSIVVPAMERFLGLETHKAHATAIAIILPLTLVSVFFYLRTGIDWAAALFVSIGGLAGGVAGARLLKKISGRWLHRIFGLFILAAAAKMVFS